MKTARSASETILIIAAVALPILIFLILKVWPNDQGLGHQLGLNDLEGGANNAANGTMIG